MRRDKTGDAVGRPSWRSSFLGDPGAEFLCGKLGIGKKKEKRSKKKERPVGTVVGNKSFTGGTNGLEGRMRGGIACESALVRTLFVDNSRGFFRLSRSIIAI